MSDNLERLSQFDISEHEKDKLVGEVIRYILFKSEQSSGCPIKREELTQLIIGKGYRQRNLPAFVIYEAKSKLSSIFGYEMRELQRSRPTVNPGRASQSQQSGADAKSYIIISQLPADVYRKFVEDTSSSHITGFTFVVVVLFLGEEPDEATLADLDVELPLGDIGGRIRARNMRNVAQEPEQQASEQPPTTEPEIYYPRPSGDGSSEAGPSQVHAYESGLDAMIDELFSNI